MCHVRIFARDFGNQSHFDYTYMWLSQIEMMSCVATEKLPEGGSRRTLWIRDRVLSCAPAASQEASRRHSKRTSLTRSRSGSVKLTVFVRHSNWQEIIMPCAESRRRTAPRRGCWLTVCPSGMCVACYAVCAGVRAGAVHALPVAE